jgi:hypothetical protein
MLNKYKNAKIVSWSKNGWQKKTATEEQIKQLTSLRPKVPCYDPVMEVNNSIDADVNIIQAVQSKIQTGSAHDEIDALPTNLKQLVQAEDTWYFGYNKVFKIIDPITQAYDGNWGTDRSEGDIEVLSENKSVVRMHLEDTHAICVDNTTEQYHDLMGELLETDNGEIIHSAPLARTDFSAIGIGDEEEDYVNEYNEAKYVVPILSDECKDKILDVTNNLKTKLQDDTICEVEREVLIAKCDQEVDQIASRELCVKLDSPYCGYKYSQPRRKHEFILGGQVSELTKAAQKREEFFYTLFAEAISCNSKDTLFGLLKETTDEHGEIKYGRPGGFVGKIRGMYNHDKELAKKWSMVDTEEELSAFTKQRIAFIRELREKGKDEETIRKAVFKTFDRTAGKIPAKYSDDGKLEFTSRSWRDSFWRQERTKALQDLFLTKAQWNAIYEMIDIQKYRIKLNFRTDEQEQKVLKALRKHYARIETIADLNNYRCWAEKRSFIFKEVHKEYKDENNKKRKRLTRKINTYKFNKSLVDCLSVTNANRWWKSLIKKRRFLQQRINLSNKLDGVIQSTHKTKIGEIAVSCIHPNCERMIIDYPKFAQLKDDKGHLFVQCECGKKVWLIEKDESGANIKTQENAEDEYLNSSKE